MKFADTSMELISFHAISASVDLAAERGRYASFDGSLWSKGILPIDSIELLQQNRSHTLRLDRSSTLDWTGLRQRVITTGMRNSNTWRSHQQRPSPTSAGSRSRLSRRIKTYS